MTCRDVQRRLAGGEPALPGMDRHLSSCAACRGLAATVAALVRAGAAERAQDLAPAALASTQRAAGLILRQRAQSLRAAPAAWWRHPAVAAALPAAAALLVALTLAHRTWQHREVAAELAAAELEQRIEDVRANLHESMARFQRLHAAPPRRDRFFVLSRQLREGVSACAQDVRRELSASRGHEAGGVSID
jgi:hypothetical protein